MWNWALTDANWIAAFGVLIEFVGFSTLGFELWRTLSSDIFDNIEITQQTGTADRIEVWDGADDGRLDLVGGQLGKLIEQINARQSGFRDRTTLIVIGLAFSAVGCFLQIIGSFGQALAAK